MTYEASARNVTTDEIIMTLIIHAYNFLWQKCFASVLPIVNMGSALSRVYDSLRFRQAYYCTLLLYSGPFMNCDIDGHDRYE